MFKTGNKLKYQVPPPQPRPQSMPANSCSCISCWASDQYMVRFFPPWCCRCRFARVLLWDLRWDRLCCRHCCSPTQKIVVHLQISKWCQITRDDKTRCSKIFCLQKNWKYKANSFLWIRWFKKRRDVNTDSFYQILYHFMMYCTSEIMGPEAILFL